MIAVCDFKARQVYSIEDTSDNRALLKRAQDDRGKFEDETNGFEAERRYQELLKTATCIERIGACSILYVLP